MSQYERIRRKVFRLVSSEDETCLPGRIFDWTILLLIVINVAMVIADTFDQQPAWYQAISPKLENISIILFTVEYILRVWTSDLLRSDLKPVRARLRFAFSFMAVIDLLAILPFYLPFVVRIDLRILRILRLLRLVRIFKLNRYTIAFGIIQEVLKAKSQQLISSMVIVLMLMIIASVLMYYAEHDTQPTVFANAFSGVWWSLATLTTVGYGDIYPITTSGKLLSAAVAVLGIGLIAIPAGITSAGFIEQADQLRRKQQEDGGKNKKSRAGEKAQEAEKTVT